MTRKIIVFADGTGNAFGTQESNVWRLFQALDQGSPDQQARYIPGVGTSGFRPFALLDGATGLGVPSNVRKLYRFICWNWRPGDEIWMFGFSRGAFTIRTLASLIASQGLVPARIGTSPVSRAEMDRNTMAAWRSYRTMTAPAGWTRPTIALTRAVRDAWLWIRHGLLGHRSYKAVRAEMGRQSVASGSFDADPREERINVRIEFLGLFDTVEAFGVPLEEMRRAIDWVIWPISFRNRVLADRVEHVRHAPALDDERTSFHPVLFDMRDEKGRDRIREVWFAGVHSDIGGGYPDPSLTLVPLNWMVEEIGALPNGGLRFNPSALAAFATNASPFGPRHDSRAGLAVTYRYRPRHVRIDEAGEGPVVHHSVLEKMASGNDLYAPVMLPGNAKVRVPSVPGAGTAASLLPLGNADIARRIPSLGPPARMPIPVQAFIDRARDVVWWRRVVFFLMLGAILGVALLPWTAGILPGLLDRLVRVLLAPIGIEHEWAIYWKGRMATEHAVSGNLDLIAPTIGGFVPGFARIYLNAIVEQPGACAAVLLLAWFLYRHSCRLRDRIADLSRCGWFASSGTPQAPALQPPYFRRSRAALTNPAAPSTLSLRLARAMRTATGAKYAYRAFNHTLAPLLFIAVFRSRQWPSWVASPSPAAAPPVPSVPKGRWTSSGPWRRATRYASMASSRPIGSVGRPTSASSVAGGTGSNSSRRNLGSTVRWSPGSPDSRRGRSSMRSPYRYVATPMRIGYSRSPESGCGTVRNSHSVTMAVPSKRCRLGMDRMRVATCRPGSGANCLQELPGGPAPSSGGPTRPAGWTSRGSRTSCPVRDSGVPKTSTGASDACRTYIRPNSCPRPTENSSCSSTMRYSDFRI